MATNQFSHRSKTFPFGIGRTESPDSILPHSHDFFEITYIYSGKGIHSVHGSQTPYCGNCFCFTPAELTHFFKSTERQSHSQLSLAVYVSWLATHAPLINIRETIQQISEQKIYVLHAPHNRIIEIKNALSVILQEYIFQSAYSAHIIAAELQKLFINIKRTLTGIDNPVLPNNRIRPAVSSALRIMETQYHSITHTKPLLDGIQINKKYFLVLFKEQIGCTPIQYLNRLRIEKACIALNTGKIPVTQAASDSGYNDMKHFNLQFKKYTKISPREFINKTRNGSINMKNYSRFTLPGISKITIP